MGLKMESDEENVKGELGRLGERGAGERGKILVRGKYLGIVEDMLS